MKKNKKIIFPVLVFIFSGLFFTILIEYIVRESNSSTGAVAYIFIPINAVLCALCVVVYQSIFKSKKIKKEEVLLKLFCSFLLILWPIVMVAKTLIYICMKIIKFYF